MLRKFVFMTMAFFAAQPSNAGEFVPGYENVFHGIMSTFVTPEGREWTDEVYIITHDNSWDIMMMPSVLSPKWKPGLVKKITLKLAPRADGTFLIDHVYSHCEGDLEMAGTGIKTKTYAKVFLKLTGLPPQLPVHYRAVFPEEIQRFNELTQIPSACY